MENFCRRDGGREACVGLRKELLRARLSEVVVVVNTPPLRSTVAPLDRYGG